MSDTTRIIGQPVRHFTRWRLIVKYAGFSALVCGMLGCSFYYMFFKTPDEDIIRSKESVTQLPPVDVPGAEAIYENDDSPGEVTLSDKDFAVRVDMACNH